MVKNPKTPKNEECIKPNIFAAYQVPDHRTYHVKQATAVEMTYLG